MLAFLFQYLSKAHSTWWKDSIIHLGKLFFDSEETWTNFPSLLHYLWCLLDVFCEVGFTCPLFYSDIFLGHSGDVALWRLTGKQSRLAILPNFYGRRSSASVGLCLQTGSIASKDSTEQSHLSWHLKFQSRPWFWGPSSSLIVSCSVCPLLWQSHLSEVSLCVQKSPSYDTDAIWIHS